MPTIILPAGTQVIVTGTAKTTTISWGCNSDQTSVVHRDHGGDRDRVQLQALGRDRLPADEGAVPALSPTRRLAV